MNIAWPDSNGLAAGNCIEEAVLHGILEVIERDAVVINEFNMIQPKVLDPRDVPEETARVRAELRRHGFGVSLGFIETDLPVIVFTAYLQSSRHHDDCSVAFGCHLDPVIGLTRALTEAVQLLPPSVNQGSWLGSESQQRHSQSVACKPSASLGEFSNNSSGDFKTDIERCIRVLADVGSEVIVVELSDCDCPFFTVRVLVSNLQPFFHEGDPRISQRFFTVPGNRGARARTTTSGDPEIWPLVGYR